jgi:hypothetical protein
MGCSSSFTGKTVDRDSGLVANLVAAPPRPGPGTTWTEPPVRLRWTAGPAPAGPAVQTKGTAQDVPVPGRCTSTRMTCSGAKPIRQRPRIAAAHGAGRSSVPPSNSARTDATDRWTGRARQSAQVAGSCGRCPYEDTIFTRPVPERTDIWRTGKITKRATSRVFAGQTIWRSNRAIGL